MTPRRLWVAVVPTSLLFHTHTLPSTVVTPYQVILTGSTKDADLGLYNFDLHPHLIYLTTLSQQKVTTSCHAHNILGIGAQCGFWLHLNRVIRDTSVMWD